MIPAIAPFMVVRFFIDGGVREKQVLSEKISKRESKSNFERGTRIRGGSLTVFNRLDWGCRSGAAVLAFLSVNLSVTSISHLIVDLHCPLSSAAYVVKINPGCGPVFMPGNFLNGAHGHIIVVHNESAGVPQCVKSELAAQVFKCGREQPLCCLCLQLPGILKSSDPVFPSLGCQMLK